METIKPELDQAAAEEERKQRVLEALRQAEANLRGKKPKGRAR